MRNTEQKILDAAVKVFSSEGYAGATTRKIAQEANVTEVTLFRKFQSKENLLKEVLIKNRHAISTLNHLLNVNKNVDIERDLCILGKEIAKDMQDEKKDSISYMFMFMLFEEGRRRPELAEILESVFKTNIDRLSEYFELQMKNGKIRNINARSAALTFVSYFSCSAFLRGIFVDYALSYSDKEVENFIDIFTKGILKVEKTEKVLEKEEKLQKLKEDISRKHEMLNSLEEQVRELEKV
jgi:AcrR family transcriptional regulator